MEDEFWLERWRRGSTGFHEPEVHAALRAHWSDADLRTSDGVFVPMCGKTRDMIWLRAQGHRVLGVELSPVAIQGFFADNKLQPSHTQNGTVDVYEADGIRVLGGNFFGVTADDVAGCSGVYDRAALVALPPHVQESYVRHMSEILPRGARMLLITLDYAAPEMKGPPFSVGHDDVTRLYASRAKAVRLLQREDVLAVNPRFAERGLTELHECTFLIEMP